MTNLERIQANNAELQECLSLAKSIISSGGGGAKFNIAYGDTAPEDTSKLWVKTSAPNGVIVSPNAERVTVGGHSVETLPDTLPRIFKFGAIGRVGSKVYLLGNTYSTKQTVNQKQIMWYNIDTGESGIEPVELEKNSYNMGYATIGSKIYLFGGIAATNGAGYSDITCYDTETQTLVTLAPTLDSGHTGQVVCAEQDGLIYVFGGMASTGYTPGHNVYLFDPEAQTLELLATLDSSSIVIGGFAERVGNDILVFNKQSQIITHFNTFSLVGKVISNKTPEGNTYLTRETLGHGVVGSKIYILGTKNNPTQIAIFDPVNCVIESTADIDTTLNVYDAGCVSVDGEIYMFGGTDKSTVLLVSTVRKYKGSEILPLVSEGTLYIEPNPDSTVVPIINTEAARVEIGVGGVFKGNTDGIGEKVKKAIYKDGAWTNI